MEEKDDGLYIAWIDTSPDPLRRAEALREKKREEAADQQLEERQLEEQIKRAHANYHRAPLAKEPTPPHASTPNSDKAVAFQLGPRVNKVAPSAAQPKEPPNIFKTARQNKVLKRKKSAEETPEESGLARSLKVKL